MPKASSSSRRPVPLLGDPFGTRRSLLHRTHRLRKPSPTRARRVPPALDLTSPAPDAPVDRGGADGRRRPRRRRPPGAAGHLDLPGGRGADRPPWSACSPPDDGRLLPGLGDAAARAAEPALGHRRPPAGRAPPAGRQRRAAAAADRSWPRSAACCSRRSRGSATCCRSGWPWARTSTSATWPRALVGAAYVRVDLVERRGEFAVRGGIVDVFPPTEEHPVRVDFFGDTVEEIRYFSVADQRSGDLTLTEVIASPCRELLLTDDVRAPGLRAGPAASRADRDAGQDRPGPRRRRDGGAVPGPGRRDGAAGRRCCRPTPTSWSAIPSWSAAGPSTWSRPARSSCTPPGPRRPAAARPRSTSAPRRTGRWPTSARPRWPGVWPGGRCRRSAPARPHGRRPLSRAGVIRTDDGEIIDF